MQSTTNAPPIHIVVFWRKSEARRTPKTAPTDPGPPNAPESPSPFEDCASTTSVMAIQTRMIKSTSKVNIYFSIGFELGFINIIRAKEFHFWQMESQSISHPRIARASFHPSQSSVSLN
jgi:hypothetical protein